MAVFDLANVKTAEVLQEVFVAHPESAVGGIQVRLEYLLDVRGPKGTPSAPRSIPLKVAPKVPQTDQSVIVHFSNLKNSVGVSRLERVLLLLDVLLLTARFDLSRRTCTEQVSILEMTQQNFEEVSALN